MKPPTYVKVALNVKANAKFSPCEKCMEHSADSCMARNVKSCYSFCCKGSSVKMDEEN
jgi:hypothetical protein